MTQNPGKIQAVSQNDTLISFSKILIGLNLSRMDLI